jgi:hypothetical protein
VAGARGAATPPGIEATPTDAPDATTCNSNSNSNDDAAESSLQQQQQRVPDECTLVMAPSTLSNDTDWGVFVRGPRRRGQALIKSTTSGGGDVVIHVHDVEQIEARLLATHNPQTADALALVSLRRLLDDYGQETALTGGFYEGNARVVAHAPGMGQLAQRRPPPRATLLPFVPTVDEGGLTRSQSPGAGAITLYHNWTWIVHRDLEAGQEVFVPDYNVPQQQQPGASPLLHTTIRSNEELRQTGYCLDHLAPLARSKIPHAGRGVAATRPLPRGTVVVPVPVLPLWHGRNVLQLWRQQRLTKSHADDKAPIPHSQLLLNYCWGHAESSLLLVPYGPWISLVNHAPLPSLANVRLQWARTTTQATSLPSWKDLQQNLTDWTGLLELVAIRDIRPGEEIWIDYGDAWTRTWEAHVADWQPPLGADAYAPAYVHDDAIQSLRTTQELQTHPYPDNIFTSCFYAYNRTTLASASESVVTVPWQVTRGVFELRNLRPCVVLKRENSQITRQRKKQGTLFTVQIKNRPGLTPEEEIPPGEVHVVSKVPRHAVRFSDKPYTTDPHLEGSFRHELHLPNDIFPEDWKDLRDETSMDEVVGV